MSSTKISASLPKELLAGIEAMRKETNVPFSVTNAELLRRGLREQTEVPKLQVRVAKLEAALAAANAELANRPEIDSRDYLLSLPPGTSAVADDLQWSEKQRRQLEVDLEAANRNAAEWEESSAVWEDRCDALKRTVAAREAHRDRLKATIVERERTIAHKDSDIAKLRTEHRSQMYAQALQAFGQGLFTGFPVAVVLSLLFLFLVPHDTAAMRFVATAAMGETGDRQRAAARLHGMPLGRAESQLQLYALVHTGENGERLNRCFEKASALKPRGKRQSIPCTLDVPREVELATTLVRKGPFNLPRHLRSELRRNEKVVVTATPSPEKAG